MTLEFAALLFMRCSALVFSSQIFGRRNIPSTVKIGFSAALAILFATGPIPIQPVPTDDMLVFLMLCVNELMFGMIFGFITNMFFTLVFTAGQLIDMQMGFGMVNVFDVQSNLSIPVTGNLLNIILLICFFSVGGHQKLIYMLYSTLVKIPVGQVNLNLNALIVAGELFAYAFVLAIHVATPIIFSGLIGEVAMGVLVRSVPQLNIFSVSLPLKVLLGFVVLMIMLPVYVNFTDKIFDGMFEALSTMFGAMVSA